MQNRSKVVSTFMLTRKEIVQTANRKLLSRKGIMNVICVKLAIMERMIPKLVSKNTIHKKFQKQKL